MDVAHPMSTVVPSLDGRVLQVLTGSTAPLSLSRVHRLAGSGSVSGIRKVLARLIRTGLVEAVPGGYLLNRDHVAAVPVELLAGMRREVLRRLTEHLATIDPTPLLTGVFGSFARGDGDADSDIDILVVTPTDAQGPQAAGSDDLGGRLAVLVQRWTGNVSHVVVVTPIDLQRMRAGGEPVLQSWDRDLVVLTGDRRVLSS
jgi:predicted nucleotidyltransferase